MFDVVSGQLDVLSVTQASWPSQMVPQTNVMLEMSLDASFYMVTLLASLQGAGTANCVCVCVSVLCTLWENCPNQPCFFFFFLMRSHVCLYVFERSKAA